MWNYLKLILTLLPGELNLDEAFKSFSEVESKGGGLHAVIDNLVVDADKIFPDPLTRPIAVFALQAIGHLYHGNHSAT